MAFEVVFLNHCSEMHNTTSTTSGSLPTVSVPINGR